MYNKKMWIYLIIYEAILLIAGEFLKDMLQGDIVDIIVISMALIPVYALLCMIGFDHTVKMGKRIAAIVTFVCLLIVFIVSCVITLLT